MPDKHHIQWDNEAKTVVLQVFERSAVLDDLYLMAEKSAAMLGRVDHTVHIIIDQSSQSFMVGATELKNMEKQVPPNQGVLVLVGRNFYNQTVKRLSETFAPKMHQSLHNVETIQEARDLLTEHYGVTYP